ncbi:flavin-containing monooxygenase [Sphingorhabdus sp. 109]|jgi:cation diffusion facilitator CzcD-associated flavoprotein CzcO|uniref:flavin-containing monooxygenase n=1 Tax=Sphingorhabdus sp. 109 TaxID=2653173 RepID=UPI0012F3FDA9|nr:NAD(P)/FAD-dependent oxidoreductase [Sphingorhabdus sp. 109]VWX59610.1 FAD-containing monooxygenase EthA [Sphingorhabdus sp. 109]
MENKIYDVLIVGAGLSGIGAAVHLSKRCPGKSFAIVEARERLGGTWDLFKYPGIRSDSDMYTLGYNFKPWTARRAIADAPSILEYLSETVAEYDLQDKIHFNNKVVDANWSSAEALWTVSLQRGDGSIDTVKCNFLHMCSGYYSYEEGHDPDFPGKADFAGEIVHPQFWPENLDYSGRKVVVIGSGATAVTLVPSMAETAAHVTMLQRSPTYIVSRPGEDKWALRLRKFLPSRLAYLLTRWKNVLMGLFMFNLARKKPAAFKGRLLEMVKEEMGPGVDMADFTPSYNPWDQRLCLVPDSDLFKALKSGKASIVTDHVETFTKDGIRLKSGKTLEADVIVTATGLKMLTGGTATISVDGKLVKFGEKINYKGVMFSGIPNFGMTMGYTNASWTLKADLTSEYVCRLINYMDKNGTPIATPTLPADGLIGTEPMLDFNSGYVQRAIKNLPKQGDRKPWRLNQNFPKDIINLRHKAIDDGVMVFSKPGAVIYQMPAKQVDTDTIAAE